MKRTKPAAGDLLGSPFVIALLLPACAFTAMAFGWAVTAAVCWLLFFFFLIVVFGQGASDAATRRRRDHAAALRQRRSPPEGMGQVPRRRSWRERRGAVFDDWPRGSDV